MKLLQDLHPVILATRRCEDMKRNLQSIARLLLQHSGQERVAFALWDKVAGAFVCQFVFPPRPGGTQTDESWEIPADPRLEDHGRWIQLPEESPSGAADPLLAPLPEEWRVRGRLSFIPLIGHVQPVALVILQGRTPCREPEPVSRDLLAIVLADLLETSRLRSETNQKTASLATIYEMYKQTDAILTSEDVIASIADAVGVLVRFDVCLLFMADAKTRRLSPRRIIGEDAAPRDLIETPDETNIGQVFRSNEPQLFHHRQLKSCLCVPIRHQTTVVGALFLGTERTYAYASSDLISVGILASHFASLDRMIGTLIQMKSYTRSFLDALNDGLIVIDNGVGITHINLPAIRLLGLRKDTEGMNCRQALDAYPELREMILETLAHGGRIDHQEIHDTQRGRTLEFTLFPFLDSEGIRLGCALLLTDVTEKREMETLLRRVDRLRALGEMTASIAHEIRNPLTGIKMVAQLMEDDDALRNSPHLLEHTRRQILEVERLDRLITEMLSFARPTPPRLATCDLTEIIEASLFLLADRLRERQLRVERRLTSPLPVLCDEGQIRQLLINVLINAIEAAPAASCLDILARESDGYALFCLSDRGAGIPEEILARIYNPFFTTKEKGTGLGLAIAHRIVEEHKGRIDIRARPGGGTECQIQLPMP